MSRGGTTKDWRAARALAFRTYGDACFKCGDKATEIDHILEVADGGTDDIENLQPLCKTCHIEKTNIFNSRRAARKRSNDGLFWGQLTPRLPSLSYLSLKPTIEPPIAPKKEKASNER